MYLEWSKEKIMRNKSRNGNLFKCTYNKTKIGKDIGTIYSKKWYSVIWQIMGYNICGKEKKARFQVS